MIAFKQDPSRVKFQQFVPPNMGFITQIPMPFPAMGIPPFQPRFTKESMAMELENLKYQKEMLQMAVAQYSEKISVIDESISNIEKFISL